MILTEKKIIELNNLFNSLNNQAYDFNVARKIALNSKMLNEEVDRLQVMLKSPYQDAFNQAREEIAALQSEYAKKDEMGNIIIENNRITVEPEKLDEFNARYQEINDKYKEGIEKYTKMCDEYLEKEVDINLQMFDAEEFGGIKLSPSEYLVLDCVIMS